MPLSNTEGSDMFFDEPFSTTTSVNPTDSALNDLIFNTTSTFSQAFPVNTTPQTIRRRPPSKTGKDFEKQMLKSYE